MTTLEDERARVAGGEAFTDAVTFAWGDAATGCFGLARAGLSPAPGGGGRRGSVLALLFAGGQPVAAVAHGGAELAADADFSALSLPGLECAVEAPLERWRVALDAGDGHGFALSFEALGAPAELAAGEPAARAGGMTGYEQLCRVHGTVTLDGRPHEVACLGQRGHQWGEPDWRRIELARTVSAWLDDGTGLTLVSVRPPGAGSHADEATWATLLDGEPERVDEPRLSTTSDGEGRQRRVGLELWMGGEDDAVYRGAGEVLCGSTLELGQLRLDSAFFGWHAQGRGGVGRYDVLRRA